MNLKYALRFAVLGGLGLIGLVCLCPLRLRSDYLHEQMTQTVDGITYTFGAYPTDRAPTGWRFPWPRRSMWGNPYAVHVTAIFKSRKDIESMSIDKVVVNATFELHGVGRSAPLSGDEKARAGWEAAFGSVRSTLPYTDWDLGLQVTLHLRNGGVMKNEVHLAMPVDHRTGFSNDLLDGLPSANRTIRAD